MINGVYRAIVKDTRDTSGQGRIKVSVPAVSGSSVTDWVWPVISSGYLVIPDPGSQVWVLFEHGDEDNPVWIGATKVHARYKNMITTIETLQSAVATLQSSVANLQSRVSSLEARP